MIPIMSMAKLLKPYISKIPEIKTLIADSLTMLGQVQFNECPKTILTQAFLKTKVFGYM